MSEEVKLEAVGYNQTRPVSYMRSPDGEAIDTIVDETRTVLTLRLPSGRITQVEVSENVISELWPKPTSSDHLFRSR